MSDKKVARPVALAVGAALAGSFALAGTAQAETGTSPFAMSVLSAGYMLGAGEGGCGADKQAQAGDEHAKGEMDAKGAEGSCGGDKAKGEMGDKEGMPKDKAAEGKCGEGKCGEGKCGGDSQ